MRPSTILLVACAAWAGLLPPQEAEHAEVRAAVERFFAMQEAEDLAGYLALWSREAQRPDPKSLQYIFDNGSDRFTDITLLRVTPVGRHVRVRVSVTRARTDARAVNADGTPRTFNTRFTTSLTFVREADGLRLVSEGTPADDLALALINAAGPDDREALLAAEPDLVNDRLVYALARRADTFAQTGKFDAAEPIYLRAAEVARRIGDPKAEGEALQNLGNSQYFRGDFVAALATYQQRLALERSSQNDAGIAAALVAVATVRYSTHEYAGALTTYREALGVYERLGDEIGVATTLVSTGNVLYLQGDYESAVADYRRSRDLHRRTFNTSGEARALEGLGRTLLAQGDLAGALEAFTGVMQEWKARNVRPMLANAALNIGDVHFRLGNLDQARAAFEESRGHHEFTKNLEGVGRLWQAIALTDLVATRFAAAEKAYGESHAACTAAHEPECVARAIVGLAFAQAAQEKFDPAIASYGKAIEAFTKLGRPVETARAEVGLSQAFFGKDDDANALAAAGRARDLAVAQQNDDVLWRARVAEARALRRMKAPDRAAAAAADAVVAIGRMWAASRLRPADRVPADSTAAFALHAVLQAEAGDAAAAFATLEQRRAQGLRVALASSEREIARGMSAEERAAERDAAVEVMSLHVQLDQERSLPRPDAARIARLQERVAPAVARRAQVEERLYARLPALRTWRGLGAPATAAELAAHLDEGETLASFAIDEHDLLLVTASRGADGPLDIRASVVPVKRQALAELIANATRPAALRDAGEWRKVAGELAAVLPSDALDRLASASRLVILPDDVLWRVPFEALPYKSGYLGDSTRVVYAGSFTALTIPAEPRPEAAGAAILAAAAPVLAPAVRERLQATAPGWTLRPAEDGEREIARALATFDPEHVVRIAGEAVTESAFRASAPDAAWLHIAVPFRMNGASPAFSPALWTAGAAAAGSQATEDDGVLLAREIMNLDLRAGAVMLSDPAGVSMRDGAAAVPVVAWAWRAAGVPVLLVTRWTVEPAAQEGFVSAFYARVSAGQAPDEALEDARAVMRKEGHPPLVWAAWAIVGRAAAKAAQTDSPSCESGLYALTREARRTPGP